MFRPEEQPVTGWFITGPSRGPGLEITVKRSVEPISRTETDAGLDNRLPHIRTPTCPPAFRDMLDQNEASVRRSRRLAKA